MRIRLPFRLAQLLAPNQDLEDCFNRGLYGIPTDEELKKMSTVKLAELLSLSKDSSPKFFVIEREYKRRLADDQAKINRKNMIQASILGGIITIMSMFIKELIF